MMVTPTIPYWLLLGIIFIAGLFFVHNTVVYTEITHMESIVIYDGPARVNHTPPPNVAVREHVREHVVQRGESLASIARLYGVERWEYIMQFNGLPNERIREGQTLLIPPPGWTPQQSWTP